MTQNLTADKWISIYSYSPDPVRNGDVDWPFRNAPIASLNRFVAYANLASTNLLIKTYSSYVLSSIGTVLSLLSLFTLWHQAFKLKNSFYLTMWFVSFLDFLFNALSVMMCFTVRRYRVVGGDNYYVMWMTAFMLGPMNTMGMAADLCALALNGERFLSVSKPQLYQSLSGRTKRILKIGAGLAIFLLSSLRMHYTVLYAITQSGSIYRYTTHPLVSTQLKIIAATISDTGLPFVLLFLMIIFSTKMISVIVKRGKKKAKRIAPVPVSAVTGISSNMYPMTTVSTLGTNLGKTSVKPTTTANTQESADANRSAIILMLSLNFLFIANQIGYSSYAIIAAIQAKTMVTFEATESDLWYWCFIQDVAGQIALACSLIEILSHSVNFAFYFTFSSKFRIEFRYFLSRIKILRGCLK